MRASPYREPKSEIPAPPQPAILSPIIVSDIQKLIDSALDRERKVLEFVQAQGEKDRQYFTHQFDTAWKMISAILTVGIALAFFFGYQSMSATREEARAAMATQIRLYQVEMERTAKESRESLNSELVKASTSATEAVHKRLGEEFDKPVIKQTIEQGVQEVVKRKVQELVSTQLTPVERRILDAESLMKINNLALNAQAGSRAAFEELRRIGRGKDRDASFANDQVGSITDVNRAGMWYGYIIMGEPAIEALKSSTSTQDFSKMILANENPKFRETAILIVRERCASSESGNEKENYSLIPIMVRALLEDPNLRVVKAAHAALTTECRVELKGYEPLQSDLFDFEGVRVWWGKYKNRPEFKVGT